jgi:hypothetical protein
MYWTRKKSDINEKINEDIYMFFKIYETALNTLGYLLYIALVLK